MSEPLITCLLMMVFTLAADFWLPQNIPGWIGRILLGGLCIFLSARYLIGKRNGKDQKRGTGGKSGKSGKTGKKGRKN